MWAFDEVRTPELAHRDRPPLRSGFEVDDAVTQELKVVVGGLGARFRGEEDGGALAREVACQGHHLLPKLMWVRGEVAKLRDRVDAHPLGLQAIHGLHDLLRGRLPLDVGRGEDVVGPHAGKYLLRRCKVEDLDPVQVDAQ